MQNPNNPWVRYADDAVIHCRTKEESENLLERLKARLVTCKLEIHPDKTRIVYCHSDNSGRHEHEAFDFLGYTFRCRITKIKTGKFFNAFTPAVSKSAAKSFREKKRECRYRGRMMTPNDLAKLMNPVIRGWVNYFSKFCPSETRKKALDFVNNLLVRWAK